MNAPQGNDPHAPFAATHAGPAYGDTLLAAVPNRDSSLFVPDATSPGEPGPPRSVVERLQALPVGIQGVWVGLVCIVLLVVSAAALRSVFGGDVSAVAPDPPPRPTVSALVASAPAPVTAAPVASAPSAPASGGSLSIGTSVAGSGATNGGFGVLGIRDRLSGHVRLRKFSLFFDDLERLLDAEPTAIDRPDVRKLVADVATYAMAPTLNGAISPDAERAFGFLTGRAGAAGPDILFELVTTRGGSRAASHAEEVLKSEAVRAKGTPAFKIAYDLRAATACDVRVGLLQRARTDGDRRVLGSLFQMARCGKTATDCCLANDAGYKETVRIINARR